MSHVEPRGIADVPELAPVFAGAEAAMGFVPNSMLTMAHMPQLPVAFMMLVNVVFGGDLKPVMAQMQAAIPDQDDPEAALPPGLVQLIAFASSVSSGCRYCQAHTSHNAHRLGEDQAKFDEILNFETSGAYSAAERAVVALALAAGAVPNEASAEHFERLREHFSERQIVQIVGVISMFGFLNRWNDPMATQLERPAVDFAAQALGAVDWTLGKHAAS
jgi:AhpD family alkylhydroperoxidase